jgi:tetratricopeptide (TPR) repeat protein
MTMTAKTRKDRILEMLADDPNDAFLRYGLGMEYLSEGAHEEALRTFRELTEVAPDYVPGYQQAGQVLTKLGRTDEARDFFRRGIATAQKVGNAHARDEMQGFLEGLG